MADTPSSASPSGAVPDAGWYADPSGSGVLRWWDGRGWTDHTHAPPSAAPTGNGTANASAAGGQPSTGAGAGSSSDVPWWATSGDGRPPSWWQDDRTNGHAEPRPFSAPGAVPESLASPMVNPYAATHSPRVVARADGVIKALVVSIISLLCCGLILGPWSIYLASQARYRIRVSNGRLGGDSLAVLAMIIGYASIGLNLLGLYLAATGHGYYSVGATPSR